MTKIAYDDDVHCVEYKLNIELKLDRQHAVSRLGVTLHYQGLPVKQIDGH